MQKIFLGNNQISSSTTSVNYGLNYGMGFIPENSGWSQQLAKVEAIRHDVFQQSLPNQEWLESRIEEIRVKL